MHIYLHGAHQTELLTPDESPDGILSAGCDVAGHALGRFHGVVRGGCGGRCEASIDEPNNPGPHGHVPGATHEFAHHAIVAAQVPDGILRLLEAAVIGLALQLRLPWRHHALAVEARPVDLPEEGMVLDVVRVVGEAAEAA